MTPELLKSLMGYALIESHRGVEGGDVPEYPGPAIKPGHEEPLRTKPACPDLSIRALLTGRLLTIAECLQRINVDGVRPSYWMLRREDIERLHSKGTSMASIELWNQTSDLFRPYDIGICSAGNPVVGKGIPGNSK